MSSLLFLALDGLDSDLVAAFAEDMPTLGTLFRDRGSALETPVGRPHDFWRAMHTRSGLVRSGRRRSGRGAGHTAPLLHDDDAAVVDVPEMPIRPASRAMQIRGWGWDDVDPLDFVTVPDSLAPQVHRWVGLPRCVQTQHSHAHPDKARVLAEFLVERITWKERLARRVLALSAKQVSFGLCEARTVVRALGCDEHREQVRHVYSALDAAVGRLLAAAPKTALIAGPNMGNAYDNNRFVPEVARALSRTTTAGHRSIRYRLARSTGAVSSTHARRCWAVPSSDGYGAIRISVAGRDRGGRIRPGRELQAVQASFVDALRTLRNAEDGTPAVQDVLAVEASDTVGHDETPDLFIRWHPQFNAALSCKWLPTLRWPSTRTALGAPREGATLVTSWERPRGAVALDDLGAVLQEQPPPKRINE